MGGLVDEGEDVGGGGDDGVGVVVFELATGAEAPGDAYGVYGGAAGGVHVDAGVADVEDVGLRRGAGGEDLEDAGGVGLGGDAVNVAHQGRKADVGEELPDDAFNGGLVFVGEDGDVDFAAVKLRQESLYAGVRLGVVSQVFVVKVLEVVHEAGNDVIKALLFGQGAAQEGFHAVAHHEAVCGELVRGVAKLLQGMVGGVAEVMNTVDEGAVEVKDYE